MRVGFRPRPPIIDTTQYPVPLGSVSDAEERVKVPRKSAMNSQMCTSAQLIIRLPLFFF